MLKDLRMEIETMSATWFGRDTAESRAILRGSAATARRRDILSRLRALFVPTSQREAHQHTARLLRRSGGRLTDDIERLLAEQLTRNGNLRF
jgi:hypothetical protein